jgi:hypothetical protein
MIKSKVAKNYNTIREALIALLCVGDSINYLHHSLGLGIMVTRHTVIEITDEFIKLADYRFSVYKFSTIEQYKGELYVWCEENGSYSYRTIPRILRMIELIKSSDTIKHTYIE